MAYLTELWKGTMVPDYIGLGIIAISWLMINTFATPFHRLFFINDVAISYPHAEVERVSVPMNFVYAMFIPLGVLIAVNLLRKAPIAKHEATYLPFAISIIFTSLVTDIIKNAVGRPRPDLLARCQPKTGTSITIPVDISVCTTDPNTHLLQDGWRSFPSGHSSFSFAGLGFLALWFAGQFQVFHDSGRRDLPRALLCAGPLLGAALIAISRCEDYRHDVYDVCFGSALGMLIAWWSYRRHWPSLSSAKSSEPYPPPDAEDSRWARVRDEEEEAGVNDVGHFEMGIPR